jgi:hypothetical protein
LSAGVVPADCFIINLTTRTALAADYLYMMEFNRGGLESDGDGYSHEALEYGDPTIAELYHHRDEPLTGGGFGEPLPEVHTGQDGMDDKEISAEYEPVLDPHSGRVVGYAYIGPGSEAYILRHENGDAVDETATRSEVRPPFNGAISGPESGGETYRDDSTAAQAEHGEQVQLGGHPHEQEEYHGLHERQEHAGQPRGQGPSEVQKLVDRAIVRITEAMREVPRGSALYDQYTDELMSMLDLQDRVRKGERRE